MMIIVGCCTSRMTYTLTVQTTSVGDNYLLPMVFPVLVFGCPFFILAGVMFAWERKKKNSVARVRPNINKNAVTNEVKDAILITTATTTTTASAVAVVPATKGSTTLRNRGKKDHTDKQEDTKEKDNNNKDVAVEIGSSTPTSTSRLSVSGVASHVAHMVKAPFEEDDNEMVKYLLWREFKRRTLVRNFAFTHTHNYTQTHTHTHTRTTTTTTTQNVQTESSRTWDRDERTQIPNLHP